MNWLIWRQHRLAGASTVVVLLGVGIPLVMTGLAMRGTYDSSDSPPASATQTHAAATCSGSSASSTGAGASSGCHGSTSCPDC